MARALPVPNASLRDQLSELTRSTRGLEDGQGARARRNARARVKRAVKRLLEKMDAAYPAPPRKAPETVKRLTGRKRMEKLQKEGWVDVKGLGGIGTDGLATVAAAGVQVVHLRWEEKALTGPGGKPVTSRATLIPGWAATVYQHQPKKLAAAAKDPTLRKAILTEVAITAPADGMAMMDRNTRKALMFAKNYGASPQTLHRMLQERTPRSASA